MAGKQYKVKLSDGIELGPVDVDTLKSWYEGGTIKKDSMVQPVGSRQWQRLMDVAPIDRWQMPEPAGHKGAKGAKATGEKRKEHPVFSEPPQRWRTYLASGLFVLAALGAGYVSFFPELWLPSLRFPYLREVALVLLALGLTLARGWEPARILVRILVLLATFALFPLAGILWIEGVRGSGLLVLACAWLFGSGFFALLARARQSALLVTGCVLVILAGAGGIAYFGVLQQHGGAGAAAAAR